MNDSDESVFQTEEQVTVTSEVHAFSVQIDSEEDLGDYVISSFSFSVPTWLDEGVKRDETGLDTKLDCDGDLDVPRKRNPPHHLRHERDATSPEVRVHSTSGNVQVNDPETIQEESLLIEHKRCTNLAEVGAQVWRGALVLADFIFNYPQLIREKYVIEIGAGTGLTSIATSICQPKELIVTDLPDNLDLIAKNFSRNLNLVRKLTRQKEPFESLKVIAMDICQVESFKNKSVLMNSNLILGADIIYDSKLSECIVKFITELAKSYLLEEKLFLFAVEKRYNFTLDELQVTAKAYEYFISLLRQTLDRLKDKRRRDVETALWVIDDNNVDASGEKRAFACCCCGSFSILSFLGEGAFIGKVQKQFFCYQKTEDMTLIILRMWRNK